MMLKESKTAIKTNVFLSEYLPISRSMKQDCPSAPLLYIIKAESMAAPLDRTQLLKVSTFRFMIMVLENQD